jgi:hypothetical protein
LICILGASLSKEKSVTARRYHLSSYLEEKTVSCGYTPDIHAISVHACEETWEIRSLSSSQAMWDERQ